MDNPGTRQRNRLSTLFSSWPEVHLAYLFGSRVNRPTGPLSDYDVGVFVEPARLADPTTVRARLAHEVGRQLHTDAVDLVLLNRAPVELAFHVIAQGERIYEESSALRVEYEAYVMGRYGDYLPVLRAQRQQIIDERYDDDRIQRYRAALGRTERTLATLRAPSGKGPDGV